MIKNTRISMENIIIWNTYYNEPKIQCKYKIFAWRPTMIQNAHGALGPNITILPVHNSRHVGVRVLVLSTKQ